MRLKSYEELVSEFQTQCEQENGVSLKDATDALVEMRLGLIYEELHELNDAVNLYQEAATPARLENVLKELADVQYTLSGFASTFGLPLDAAFRRVHNSNLTKVNPLVKNGDGKVLKGPNYAAPNLMDLVTDYLINTQEIRTNV